MAYVEKTVGAELERKSMDAVLELHARLESKQISPESFLVAMDALFRVFSGLVSQELMQLHQDVYTQIQQEIE